jgi:hypothetical protein
MQGFVEPSAHDMAVSAEKRVGVFLATQGPYSAVIFGILTR